MGFSDLLGMAKTTLQNPRLGLRAVLDLGLARPTQIMSLALVSVLSSILTHLSAAITPITDFPMLEMLLGSPLQTAMMQFVGMVVTAALVLWIGRAMGGQGRFDEVLITVVWLQIFMLALEGISLIGSATGLTLLSFLAAVLSLGLFPWLFTLFVTEVHKFTRPVKVFFGIVLSTFVLIFALSFLLVGILGPESFAHV